MKAKLFIGLFLLMSNMIAAQTSKIELGVNLIPSYYKSSNPDILDYVYETKRAKEFVLVNNLNFDFMLFKNIGFQIGLQAHNIKLESIDLVEYQMAGSELIRTINANYSVKTTVRQYEAPINLILRHPLNSKIDLSILIGGSRILRSKTIKYELRNKETGEVEKKKSSLRKNKTMSNFSPQIQFRIQYEILEHLKINSLILIKSTKISNLEKFYLGAGIGVSYVLN